MRRLSRPLSNSRPPPHRFASPVLGLRKPAMAAPITPEASQFSRTTFIEPAICRPKQGAARPPLDIPPIWSHSDSQERIKVSPADPAPFEGNSFSGRSYSNSFLRSSANHHTSQPRLPPPLAESPSSRRYLGFGSFPQYPESPQYYLPSADPHTASGSPTFPLRPSDDWWLTRASPLSSSQDSVWGQNHSVLAGSPEISYRRGYSISSDVTSTPVRESDPHIPPAVSEPSWDRQFVDLPSPRHVPQVPPPITHRPAATPWTIGSGDTASRVRQPAFTARIRTSHACEMCRHRKSKVCSRSNKVCSPESDE